MAKIRKRARAFMEYKAQHHNPVEWGYGKSLRDFGHFDWLDMRDSERDGYDVPIWRIPLAGDFNPSDLIEKSNYRSLLRDFPDDGLVTISYHNGDALAVLLNKASKGLLEALEGLLDYAIYDESDYSTLEWENMEECWDSYGRSDLRRELERRGFDTDDVTDSDLDDAWLKAVDDLGICHETDGDSAYWPGLADDETSAYVADKLGLKGVGAM